MEVEVEYQQHSEVCYNFMYRQPETATQLLMHYFVARELYIAPTGRKVCRIVISNDRSDRLILYQFPTCSDSSSAIRMYT